MWTWHFGPLPILWEEQPDRIGPREQYGSKNKSGTMIPELFLPPFFVLFVAELVIWPPKMSRHGT